MAAEVAVLQDCTISAWVTGLHYYYSSKLLIYY